MLSSNILIHSKWPFFVLTLKCYFIRHHLQRAHYAYLQWMPSKKKKKGIFSSILFFEENKLDVIFLSKNFACSVEHQKNGAYSSRVHMNWLEFIPMQLNTKRLRHLSIFTSLFSGYVQWMQLKLFQLLISNCMHIQEEAWKAGWSLYLLVSV